MRRAFVRTAATAVALVACAAPASAAAQGTYLPLELTQRPERAFGPVETDGRRWATFAPTATPLSDFVTGGSTLVVDTARDVEWAVPGCAPQHPRDGRAELTCGNDVKTLDLATRRVTTWSLDDSRRDGPPPVLVRGTVLAVDSEAEIPPYINRWGRPVSRPLILIADGKRRVVRRSCRCTDIRFSARWLTWSAGISVFAHDVATARTWRWTPSADALKQLGVPLPSGGRTIPPDLLDVAHTRTRIFVSYRAGAVEPWARQAWHVVFEGPLKPSA